MLRQLLTPLEKPPKSHRPNHTLAHHLVLSVEPSKLFLRLIDYSRDKHGNPGPDFSDGKMYVVTEVADYSLKDYLGVRLEEGGHMSRESVRQVGWIIFFHFRMSCSMMGI